MQEPCHFLSIILQHPLLENRAFSQFRHLEKYQCSQFHRSCQTPLIPIRLSTRCQLFCLARTSQFHPKKILRPSECWTHLLSPGRRDVYESPDCLEAFDSFSTSSYVFQ